MTATRVDLSDLLLEVFWIFTEAGSGGITAEEIKKKTGQELPIVTAAMNELRKRSYIVPVTPPGPLWRLKGPSWEAEVRENLTTGKHLYVGRTADNREVCVNLPPLTADRDGISHIIFSPDQAQQFGLLLMKTAGQCDFRGPKCFIHLVHDFEGQPAGTPCEALQLNLPEKLVQVQFEGGRTEWVPVDALKANESVS